MTTAPQLDLAASLAGRYTIERELGRGGMATVYAARDLKHDRVVALKVLLPELAATLGPERFRREITVAAKLQHPHILSVYDSGETPAGQLWFTMPYVEGESLRDRLRRERQLSVDDALRITRDVAGALEYAHTHGVLHRDVKPENVLLTSQGNALLADFGIARALAATPDGSGLTETGLAVGTPQYMSPEQAVGERTLDARSDEFALGAVCYEMLAGEPPFVGSSAQAVLAKMVSMDAPSVRVLRPAVSPGIDQAIRRALARTPADRWATAGAFAGALTAAERLGGPARRVPARFALLGLGFLVGIGALFAWRHHEGEGAPAAGGPVGLAVLPFDNGGDTANAYFADGITDEIRGKLSALPALWLIASASSNKYRHSPKPTEQIGRELGVQYLLMGRVRWEQAENGTKRVRVSPELVEVRAGMTSQTRWQQSYDTTLADVFDVQAAVATRVADKLGVVLSQPAQKQLATPPTRNLAAYDAYLRSVALDGQDLPTVRRSLRAAEQAIALDSNFSAAWAQVSVCKSILYGSPIPVPADSASAHLAAERAIALAPASPVGYIALGDYELIVTFDHAAARAAFQSAIRLAPSSSTAANALASVEIATGQWSDAVDQLRRAASLNPRGTSVAELRSETLAHLRRFPEARAEAERGLVIAPADVNLIVTRATSFLGEGDLAGARRALRDVPPALDRGTLALSMFDTFWALDSADRALVLTLPLSAFDNDRADWALARAEMYWLAGDTAQARRLADTTLAAVGPVLHPTSGDVSRLQHRGIASSYLGRRASAARDGELALKLSLETGDQAVTIPFGRYILARIYAANDDHEHALDQADSILAKPYFISPKMLMIDPTWTRMKTESRFKRLTK